MKKASGLAIISGLIWALLKMAARTISKRKTRPPQRRKVVPPVEPDTYIAFDVETTGLDPTKHEIIEIGAIMRRRGQASDAHQSFHALIKPRRKISARITEITGITNEMLADGMDAAQALQGLMDFIGDHPLVAHNAEFDKGFLLAACERHGLPRPSNPFICTLEMARQHMPGQASYKLAHLTRSMKAPSHRALGDAQRTLVLFVSMHK